MFHWRLDMWLWTGGSYRTCMSLFFKFIFGMCVCIVRYSFSLSCSCFFFLSSSTTVTREVARVRKRPIRGSLNSWTWIMMPGSFSPIKGPCDTWQWTPTPIHPFSIPSLFHSRLSGTVGQLELSASCFHVFMWCFHVMFSLENNNVWVISLVVNHHWQLYITAAYVEPVIRET